jgi:mRNA-degrading endonuclease YafQ of YafQ-DinJ toxin-antitoxin module
LVSENPFIPELHTHKVISKEFGSAFSSRVNGDIRIIWNYDKFGVMTILLLDLGGHSGFGRVY